MIMNNRLIKIAKYLGSVGLYEEAAKVKKLAGYSPIWGFDEDEPSGEGLRDTLPNPMSRMPDGKIPEGTKWDSDMIGTWAHMSDENWGHIYDENIASCFYDWCKVSGRPCKRWVDAEKAIDDLFNIDWKWRLQTPSDYLLARSFDGIGGNPTGESRKIPSKRKRRVKHIISQIGPTDHWSERNFTMSNEDGWALIEEPT
jgi:hypothetical protein